MAMRNSTDPENGRPSSAHAADAEQVRVIDFWSDLGCPWASLAVHRFRKTRQALGLDGRIVLRHRTFPLELINGRGTPKAALDAELDVLTRIQPDLGWTVWSADEWLYPGSLLLPLEAVRAAQFEDVGGLSASEDLDAALRRAFYAESRPIGLYTEIVAVAQYCTAVDITALERRLESGIARRQIFDDLRAWPELGVQGSPQLVLPSGKRWHNPGLEIEWSQDQDGEWHVRVTSDDPGIYESVLLEAVSPQSAPHPQ